MNCGFGGCVRPVKTKGLCDPHYLQKCRTGVLKPLTQRRAPLAVRFWRKVIKGDGCWEWSGARAPKGYGRLQTPQGVTLAHRLSWEFEHGPVPVGLFVLHRCDNPPCVRIDHLFVGTAMDNTSDMIAKGRQRFPGPRLSQRRGAGVRRNGPGWGAIIGDVWLGTFETEELATLVSAEARLRYHGRPVAERRLLRHL